MCKIYCWSVRVVKLRRYQIAIIASAVGHPLNPITTALLNSADKIQI